MIILDTNVVSELMWRPKADASVLQWARHLTERPWTTAITRGEIMAGIAGVPRGTRRNDMAAAARDVLAKLAGMLPYSDESTDAFAAIVASRRALRLRVDPVDAQIAAIALTYGAAVATRNVKDFDGIGLTLINPWES